MDSNSKSPDRRVGAFLIQLGLLAAAARFGLARRGSFRSLLALGALAIHRPGLEAAFFQPALDLVFGEADIGFDPRVRDESLLHVCMNGLAVNL